ncbi:MAG TPA: protein kinase [Elusimicrobiota bacterium]|nr:protein kinase [Elusimicrobiota bacterium]
MSAFRLILAFCIAGAANAVTDRQRGFLQGAADSITRSKREIDAATTPEARSAAQRALENTARQLNDFADQNSADADAQLAVSRTFLQAQEPARASPLADRAVALAPDDLDARLNRAQVRYELKDYAGAVADARLVLAGQPGNQPANAIVKLVQKNVAAAEAPRPPSPADSPPPPDAAGTDELMPAPLPAATPAQTSSRELLRQALAKDKIGDHAGAADLAKKAAELDHGNGQALLAYAAAILPSGRADEAARAAQAALDAGFRAPIAHVLLGLAKLRAGDPLGAVQAADAAIAVNPRHARAFWLRAKSQDALGRAEEALEDYRRAAALNPEYSAEFQAASRRAASRPGGVPPPPADAGQRGFVAGAGLAVLIGLAFVLGSRRGAATAVLSGAATPSPAPANYRVGRKLGEGGMGAVYEAEDLKLGRTVALKRLRAELRGNAKEYARFLNEARLVASLRHPNIVEIYGIEEGPETYLVFELVPGKTLADCVHERGGKLERAEVLGTLDSIAKAVDYAHARGVAHLDLKPSNVMVEPDGRVKVMDFGIARNAKDSMAAMTHTALGTPLYMAPEQEDGHGAPSSDVFALGAIAYELLSGAAPFPAGSPSAKREGRFKNPPPGVAAGLAPFFARALAADPARRFPSAGALVAELKALLDGKPAA